MYSKEQFYNLAHYKLRRWFKMFKSLYPEDAAQAAALAAEEGYRLQKLQACFPDWKAGKKPANLVGNILYAQVKAYGLDYERRKTGNLDDVEVSEEVFEHIMENATLVQWGRARLRKTKQILQAAKENNECAACRIEKIKKKAVYKSPLPLCYRHYAIARRLIENPEYGPSCRKSKGVRRSYKKCGKCGDNAVYQNPPLCQKCYSLERYRDKAEEINKQRRLKRALLKVQKTKENRGE